MKRKIATILMLGLLIGSLSACGKNKEPEESITKVEASDVAESKEQSEVRYEDTNKEQVVAPDRNGSNTDGEDNAEEEEIDLTGVMGYWFDDNNNYIQLYHDVDDNGNELETISYTGYLVNQDLYLYGTAETDDSTFIKCQQYSYTSEVSEDATEIEIEAETEEEIIREEFVDPDTGEVIILERSATDKDWVFDEQGKIVGYIDIDGAQQEVPEEDKAMVEAFNKNVGTDGITEDSPSDEAEEITYTIVSIEADKENNCTRMVLNMYGTDYTFVRYN